MRAIEEKIDIPESRKDDFRRELMNYIGALAIEGKQFDYKMNERLHRALELKTVTKINAIPLNSRRSFQMWLINKHKRRSKWLRVD